MVERPDTWKKMSAVSKASACDGNMAVKLQRSYHRNDEDETEVEKDNAAKGWESIESRIIKSHFGLLLSEMLPFVVENGLQLICTIDVNVLYMYLVYLL